MSDNTVTVKPGVTHRIVVYNTITDALTGQEWEYRECPTCGHSDRFCWEPVACKTLERGTMPWASHVHVSIPTEDELRALARRHGMEAEFEAALRQAIVEGKPLLRFNLGGESAETWAKGTGPSICTPPA